MSFQSTKLKGTGKFLVSLEEVVVGVDDVELKPGDDWRFTEAGARIYKTFGVGLDEFCTHHGLILDPDTTHIEVQPHLFESRHTVVLRGYATKETKNEKN